MKFTSFKNWLFERNVEKLEYGCIMMGTDIPDWESKISIVKKEDVYKKDNDYGYEKEPHVTIVYGLHEDEIDLNEILEHVEMLKPLQITINKIGIFPGEEYDVVKFEVPVTNELTEYRKFFMKYPNTQTYPKYQPHLTIAYVKSGEGQKYAQKVKPFDVIFNKAIYSSPDEEKKIFDLK